MEKRRKFQLHDGKAGAAITVTIATGASKCSLVGITNDGVIQIKVTAANQIEANQELTVYLSKLLNHPQKHIEVLAGTDKPEKLVAILGMDSEIVQAHLLKAVGK